MWLCGVYHLIVAWGSGGCNRSVVVLMQYHRYVLVTGEHVTALLGLQRERGPGNRMS